MIVMQPQGPVEFPRMVTEFAAGRPTRAVWKNELGGLTFQVGLDDARQFVKWTPAGSGIDLSAEVARLGWASKFVVVPRVLDAGADEAGSWIITVGPTRLEAVRSRAAAGRINPANWHRDLQQFGTVEQALDVLADIPPVDELVVCHGDACAPNTLVGDDGTCTGHVDLGALGVADRWADLAIATWSTRWNYGPGWGQPLLEAYGVEPDLERIMYYRLLWELSD
jgi:aminoglycoside phosphotransferase